MEDLPSRGSGGQQIVARLEASSKAAAGGELELGLDISKLRLFDPDGGLNLT